MMVGIVCCLPSSVIFLREKKKWSFVQREIWESNWGGRGKVINSVLFINTSLLTFVFHFFLLLHFFFLTVGLKIFL